MSEAEQRMKGRRIIRVEELKADDSCHTLRLTLDDGAVVTIYACWRNDSSADLEIEVEGER